MNSVKPPSVSKTAHNKLVTLIAAAIMATLITIQLQSVQMGVIAFIVCFLLDLDHLVDYLLYIKKFNKRFDFKEFLSGTYFIEWKKFITPGHSWELVLIFMLMYAQYGYKIAIVLAVSLTTHYVVDYITNDVNRVAYFFLYRMQYGFAKTSIKR